MDLPITQYTRDDEEPYFSINVDHIDDELYCYFNEFPNILTMPISKLTGISIALPLKTIHA